MPNHCNNCPTKPEMMTEVLKIYQQGNPIKGMEVLTEVLAHDKNLHHDDREEVAQVIHLLAAIAKQRDQDQTELLQEFKIPA